MKITALLVLVCFVGVLNAQTSYDDALDTIRPNKVQLKKKHRNWLPCDVIFAKDTIHMKIKYMQGFRDVNWTAAGAIVVADSNEVEETLKPVDFSAFIVHLDTVDDKYISLYDDDPDNVQDLSRKRLHFVIVDGKCKLLANLAAALPNGRLPAGDVTLYHTFYKGQLTQVKTEGAFYNTSISFKDKCEKVFTDCPWLIKEIENNTYKPKDLPEIVKQFNRCLDDKQRAQKKF